MIAITPAPLLVANVTIQSAASGLERRVISTDALHRWLCEPFP
jgi:hypothetical protein